MKIRVYSGKWSNTCTVSNNLTENQMKVPAIRDIIEYAEPRMLSTLIVSGVTSDWQMKSSTKKTNIGTVPDGQLIGDNAYRYKVMGRIQRKSIINSQIGSSNSDGTFTLSMKDNLLYPGMVTRFFTGLHARVESGPLGASGNYVYTFRTVNGTVFDWATHVAIQPGEFTCMGGYTMYGEGSLRGYDRGFYPDEYINHLTIQRKTIEITGDALSDVTWIKVQDKGGWYFTQEKQAKVRFNKENEYGKWHGESTMRDQFGNLLSQSRMIDPETGKPIIAGDGVIEQIRGANDLSPSGVDGFPTIDDFKDMMTMLEKKSDAEFDNVWYVVSGTDGYVHAQETLRDYWVNSLGGHNNNQNSQEQVEVGQFFDTFKFAGNKLVFVKNVGWDDEQMFPALGADGKMVQSGSYIFLNNGLRGDGKRNCEILAKGANGANRSMITGYVNGLTGWTEKVMQGSVDALQFNMLKHDNIFIYNTMSCGMINKPMA